MKRPSLQFYPGDWRKDPAVQSLSYFDRGVWIELLCIMHESEERGVLLLNGCPMPIEAVQNCLGLDNQTTTKTLATLQARGVAKVRESDGAIYSKRMVEDERLSEIRRNAGSLGGNPVLLNQTASKTQANSKQTVEQKPTPSSSSSSSEDQDQSHKQDQKSLRTSCASASELLADVSPEVAADFIELRKKKRAPLTATAVKGIRREAAKAGLALEAVLAICCERGWTGFRADWDWRGDIRAGPQQVGATSKAGQAIEILEGMKRGHKNTDSGTDAAVVVPRIGTATSG